MEGMVFRDDPKAKDLGAIWIRWSFLDDNG